MAWYNNIFNREQSEDEEKLNPAQVIISRDEGFSIGTSENYINYAKNATDAEIISGGNYDKSEGYFISPTTILTSNLKFKTMVEEIN